MDQADFTDFERATARALLALTREISKRCAVAYVASVDIKRSGEAFVATVRGEDPRDITLISSMIGDNDVNTIRFCDKLSAMVRQEED